MQKGCERGVDCISREWCAILGTCRDDTCISWRYFLLRAMIRFDQCKLQTASHEFKVPYSLFHFRRISQFQASPKNYINFVLIFVKFIKMKCT